MPDDNEQETERLAVIVMYLQLDVLLTVPISVLLHNISVKVLSGCLFWKCSMQ